MRFRGRSHDLDIKDYAFSSTDPFRHAEDLGCAISEVQNALPRRKNTVFAAILRIGDNGRRSIVYRQPTVAEFHEIVVPRDRRLCTEPVIDGDQVHYALPKLTTTGGRSITIPKIEMLESSNSHIEPVKLLLGRDAVKFAAKHKIDVARDRKLAAARRENYERIRTTRIH